MSTSSPGPVSDSELVATLPGFKNAHAEGDGIRSHYVEGGSVEPIILLPQLAMDRRIRLASCSR